MAISKKRQKEISGDAPVIQRIYESACQRWGIDAVHHDLTRLWDLRCIWGLQNIVPFRSMNCQNLSEFLWVAEIICGYKQSPNKPLNPTHKSTGGLA